MPLPSFLVPRLPLEAQRAKWGHSLLKQRGGVTIMTLVLLIVFVIITSASISYISRQAHETANKTQEEQAFGLGDAGIPYAQWLLSDKGGKATPLELAQAFQEGSVSNELYAAFSGADGNGRPVCSDGICGPNATVLGTFKLAFGYDGDTGQVEVLSVGKDVNKPGECQRVRAFLVPFGDTGYQVVRWDHEPSRDCAITSDAVEFTDTQCSDDADNDGDGVRDDADFSCESDADNDETLQKSQCQNQIDDDKDGTTDYRTDGSGDAGCSNNQDNDELSGAICNNGINDDGLEGADYRTDGNGDPHCQGPAGTTESPLAACSDGIDNDNDGPRDFPTDTGCSSAADPNERGASEQCDNGINDDGDTGTDYVLPGFTGGDTHCFSRTDNTEDDSPLNDHFTNAIDVTTLSGVHTVSTVYATEQTGENLSPCVAKLGKTVWYKYTNTLPTDVRVAATTEGSTFNTVLAAYRGTSLASAQLVACNDNSNAETSAVAFTATAGQTYYFQVSGKNDLSGQANFRFNHVSCSTTAMSAPTTTDQFAYGSLSSTEDCLSTDRSGSFADLFTFPGTANTQVRIQMQTYQSPFAPYIYLKRPNGTIVNGSYGESSWCTTGSNNACIRPENNLSSPEYIDLPATETYTIVATSNFASQLGNYYIGLAKAPDGPVNNHFANAHNMGCTGCYLPQVNTQFATLQTTLGEFSPSCVSNIGKTVWYRYTHPSVNTLPQTFSFGTANNTNSFTLGVGVYVGSSLSTLQQISCATIPTNTYSGSNGATFTAQPGATYYIQVGGPNSAFGTFTGILSPVSGPPPPPPSSPSPRPTSTPR